MLESEENEWMLWAVLGLFLVIFYIIFRKKEKPRDVFYTSKTSSIQAETNPASAIKQEDFSSEADLKDYSVYYWLCRVKDKNNFMRKCWELADRFTDKYPRFFEWIYKSIFLPWTDEEIEQLGLGPVEKYIRPIEHSGVYLLLFILYASLLFSLKSFIIICTLSLISLANVVYCFKKMDKEIKQKELHTHCAKHKNDNL